MTLSLPVIVAPMFLVSGVEMVINSCKNGIIGSVPSLNARTHEDFESMIQTIHTELDKHHEQSAHPAAPYAVNLIVHKTNSRLQADLETCIKYKVPIVITSLGVSKEVIDAIHDYGGLVFHDIINRRHAQKASDMNVDGLILVCHGAGGHAGLSHPFAFVHEVRKFFSKTIILSGTISTGEDILAAQALGVDYVYMGTRFIASTESLATDAYKNMILKSEISDIIYTDKISGVHANFLKESIMRSGLDIDKMLAPTESFSSEKLETEKKAWKDIWSAGQGVTAVHDILSIQDIVSSLKREYRDALENIIKNSKAYL